MNLRGSCTYCVCVCGGGGGGGGGGVELSSSFCVIVCVLCVLYTLLYLEEIKNLSFAAI